MKIIYVITLSLLILLSGCAATNDRILDVDNETQLQKRNYQSRIFDTSNKEKVLRATLSTLQDLGFVIDNANFMLGSVSGTKLDRRNKIKITVSVRPKGTDRMIVRANAQFNVSPVKDPKQYQNFFISLEKSLFLTAHLGE